MKSYEEQVKAFKDIVPIGVKRVPELIELLKRQVDLKEVTAEDLQYLEADTAKYNASCYIDSRGLQLKPEEMSFIYFQVIENEKSAHYDNVYPESGYIYIIIEEHSGYLTTNSNWLSIEIDFARGISQHDLDTEGVPFQSLIAGLAFAEEEGYIISSWRD